MKVYSTPSLVKQKFEFASPILVTSPNSREADCEYEMERFFTDIDHGESSSICRKKVNLDGCLGLKNELRFEQYKFSYYIIPFSEKDDAIIAICLFLSDELVDAFENWSDSDLETLSESHPLLADSVRNSRCKLNNGYSLVGIKDDHGRKCCLIQTINFLTDGTEEDMSHELMRTDRLAGHMIKYACDLLEELANVEMSDSQKFKIQYLHPIIDGAKNGLKYARYINLFN